MSLIIYGIICIPKRGTALRLEFLWSVEPEHVDPRRPLENNSKQPQKLCLDCKFTSQTLVFDKLLWEQATGLMFYAQITTNGSKNEQQRYLFSWSFSSKTDISSAEKQ